MEKDVQFLSTYIFFSVFPVGDDQPMNSTWQDSKFEWLEATVEKALECARGGEWGSGDAQLFLGKLSFRWQKITKAMSSRDVWL